MRDKCSARIGVNVAGMCCVSTTGSATRRPNPCTSVNNAWGPPVELPIANKRGAVRSRGGPGSGTAAAAAERRRMRASPFTLANNSRLKLSFAIVAIVGLWT